jgi:long-subunit fatty acid transport protein
MKTMTKLAAILLAAAVSAACPAMAQDTTTTQTNAPSKPVRPAGTRFNGIIASIDSTNMIVTLKATARKPEQKIKITSDTKIKKDTDPGEFKDAVVGMSVSGSCKKGDDGVITATTLIIRTKAPTPKPPPATAPPAA